MGAIMLMCGKRRPWFLLPFGTRWPHRQHQPQPHHQCLHQPSLNNPPASKLNSLTRIHILSMVALYSLIWASIFCFSFFFWCVHTCGILCEAAMMSLACSQFLRLLCCAPSRRLSRLHVAHVFIFAATASLA